MTCFEALDLPGRQCDVVRPFAMEVGAGDLALAPCHRRCVAISLAAGISRSFATVSIASRSSVASTVASHTAFEAALKTSKDESIGGSGLRGMLAVLVSGYVH